MPAAKEEKVEKKPSAPAAAPEKAEVTKAASVVQSLNGSQREPIEMETDRPADQPTAGGAVSSAVEMGGKDEDDKVSQ